MPISLATSAMTGAAPVPVPPPMPVVMKTMSAPCSTSEMRSRSSIAAWRPTSGFAPAPRPLVTPGPSCSTVRAPMFFSAWASVLAQMNSTPSMLLFAMWLTALPPPPPTPITLITAVCGTLSTSSNISPLLPFLVFRLLRTAFKNCPGPSVSAVPVQVPWVRRHSRSYCCHWTWACRRSACAARTAAGPHQWNR
ncbi:hypothetical protein D3C85_1146870 [compost metagenome]